METMYFVTYVRHNKETGGVAYKTELGTTDKSNALKTYHALLGEYVGNKSFDFVCLMLTDCYGNMIQKEYWTEQ